VAGDLAQSGLRSTVLDSTSGRNKRVMRAGDVKERIQYSSKPNKRDADINIISFDEVKGVVDWIHKTWSGL